MHEFYTYDISIIFVNLVKITGKKKAVQLSKHAQSDETVERLFVR